MFVSWFTGALFPPFSESVLREEGSAGSWGWQLYGGVLCYTMRGLLVMRGFVAQLTVFNLQIKENRKFTVIL